MGLRSSKVVITPETKSTAAAPEGTVTPAKEVFENGNTEAIPSIDEVPAEPNGDSTSPADDPNATIPAVEECPESKKAEEQPVAAPPTEDIQTQAEEVTNIDQGTEKSELPASTTEPVVEIVPTENCVASQEGAEHFVVEQEAAPLEEEEAPKPVEVTEHGDVEQQDESATEPAEDESNNSALAEKLAHLEIESNAVETVEPEAVVSNGDAAELHDN